MTSVTIIRTYPLQHNFLSLLITKLSHYLHQHVSTRIIHLQSNLENKYFNFFFNFYILTFSRSQWPRGLRRRSTAARLLRSWFRIPPGALLSVCCECCVLSGRGLCDGLITHPEESYRLWRVVVCDQETSNTRRLKPATGLWKYNHDALKRQEIQTNKHSYTYQTSLEVTNYT